MKSWLIGKDSDARRDRRQEEKGMTEDEMDEWHHQLDAHEFGWTLGVGDGQGSLACCDSWGHRESDTTERLNWTELNCLGFLILEMWRMISMIINNYIPSLFRELNEVHKALRAEWPVLSTKQCQAQPVHSEGDQPWDLFGRNDAKAETPVLWPPHAKSWLTGKDSDAGRDWGQEEKGTTEDEMAGWHHWLDGLESEWTPGVGDGQGGLVCCDSSGRKESDTTERLNWAELNVRQQLLGIPWWSRG